MNVDSTTTSIVSSINPQMHQGELRILDTDLALRLGFERPHDIRKLIKRHEANLLKLGVSATVALTSGPNGGPRATAFYLNRKQAIFITGKSDTPEATAITIEIIEKFDAYERGVAPAIAAPTNLREALMLALEQQDKIEAQQKALAIAEPKAEALDALSNLDGRHNLRDAAKQCGWTEQAFVARLMQIGWIYPSPTTGRKCAYSDKVKAGLMDVKNVPVTRSSGVVEGVGQPLITQKGLAKLRVLLGPQPGRAPVPFTKQPELAS